MDLASKIGQSSLSIRGAWTDHLAVELFEAWRGQMSGGALVSNR
jgi:hypothetical protein